MIYGPFSKYVDSSEAIVAPGAVIDHEGMVLVRSKTAQFQGVKPSTGTADDLFAGFSIAGTSAAPFIEGFANKQETFSADIVGTSVELQFAPLPNQVFAFDLSTNAAVTPITVTGKTVSGLTPGHAVQITYKYTLTVVQARSLQGDQQPGGYSGAYVGQIGLLKRGLIYTSEFDASKNWMAATEVRTGAGGQVTDQSGSAGGPGVVIPAQIVAIPSSEVTFLGLEFSAV